MKLRTLSTADLKKKRVLVRVDFNVPIQNGKLQDKTRLLESLPTLSYLKGQDAKIILLSHLGRPKGKVVAELKMDKIAVELSKLMGQKIHKLDDCQGEEVERAVFKMKPGEIILLENVRFHEEEEKNDLEFARSLARLAEVYVNDAFGTLHRAHASTEAVAHLLPAYAGLLVEKELKFLDALKEKSTSPLCLILGGAKIDTKIGLLEKFLPLADVFVIGGAVANTFLAAQGISIGASLFEPEKVGIAKQFLSDLGDKKLILPTDVITAIHPNRKGILRALPDIKSNEKILDIGPKTLLRIADTLKTCKTILWNGPMGVYEKEAFSEGTRKLAQVLAELHVTTILGGGDTLDAVHRFNISFDKFTHISTGGGAMLEFLEGKSLAGLKVLSEES